MRLRFCNLFSYLALLVVCNRQSISTSHHQHRDNDDNNKHSEHSEKENDEILHKNIDELSAIGHNHLVVIERDLPRKLPSIFLLGAQKGGSSSLYELMIQHPQFCGGYHKEPHYFTLKENFLQGLQFYKDNYIDPKCRTVNNTFFIDGTTALHHPTMLISGLKMALTVQERRELKFIALLREPVARDNSWYEHSTREMLYKTLTPFTEIRTFKVCPENFNYVQDMPESSSHSVRTSHPLHPFYITTSITCVSKGNL